MPEADCRILNDNAGLGGGGPEGGYGLWIDSQLAAGSSEPCATFGNPSALLSSTGARHDSMSRLDETADIGSRRVRFRVAAVEVWALGDHAAAQIRRNAEAGVRRKP